MAQGRRSTGPGGLGPEALIVFFGLGALALVGAGVWSSLALAAAIDGTESPGGNPFAVLFDLMSGGLTWSGTATAVLITEIVVLVALVVLVWMAIRRSRGSTSRVDKAATLMARRPDLAKLTREGAQATANRLGAGHAGPGIFIGKTVAGDIGLFGSWEDMHVDIWGPRTGKTTSRAIPAILDAPGAVIATSNKRDIVDATRGPRSERGPVWVFDPQSVCGEEPTWWWDPLSSVKDEVTARELADQFVSSQRKEGQRTDAYWDTASTDLLSGFILAASLGKKPITQIYLWLTDQLNDEPERILKSFPGYELSANQVSAMIHLPEKQRAGVYGWAQQVAQFLVNRQVAQWVTPQGPNDRRPKFDQYRFVREGGSLYSLSKEGLGTAGPLVAALTVAVVRAAEDYAKECPNGRLPSPLVGVLDEAANVCRWKDLPDLYSHFGSRGIVLMTILQSWAQGLECWGEHGMEKLWSASNIRVYGGGVSDASFLERLSKLIGDYDISSRSVTYGKGERSHSSQVQRHNIMEVSDLTSMPAGRAVVFASGTPATMIRTVPWMVRPDAGSVKASFARYDPGVAAKAQQLDGSGANAWVSAGRNVRTRPNVPPSQPAGPPPGPPPGEQSWAPGNQSWAPPDAGQVRRPPWGNGDNLSN